jgi:hypothetical protein
MLQRVCLALPRLHRYPTTLQPCAFQLSPLHPKYSIVHSQRLEIGLVGILKMAEAIAGLSVGARIVLLVDFSTKVVRRLDEFTTHAGEIPKCFRQVKTELPLLNTTLQQMQQTIDTNSVADGSKKALLPVIAGCHEQIAQLDAILTKALPEGNDSWREKGKKAMVSLRHDTKVENITRVLRNYIGILTFYCVAASSALQPLTGRLL